MKITITKTVNKLNSPEFGELHKLYFSNGGVVDLIHHPDDGDIAILEVLHEVDDKDKDIGKRIKLQQFINDLTALKQLSIRSQDLGEIQVNTDVHEKGTTLTYSLSISLRDNRIIETS